MAEHTDDRAPSLPTVHDEAGDSPMWLPVLGLTLLVLTLLTVVFRGALGGYEAAGAAEAPPPAEAPAAE